jgi:ABC-type Fe3+/spermidine/putrescine transport system ATPase subunit
VLEIQHLQKTYSGAEGPALADFDLTIADGEFVTLIGPSGCGKTTALRIGGRRAFQRRISVRPVA